jgi:histidinol dehydrogenase
VPSSTLLTTYSAGLSKILISSSDPKWQQRLNELRQRLFEATYFKPKDKRAEQLSRILEAVRVKKDKALQLFTQKFDGVRIAADKFKVNRKEIQKAYNNIDSNLLTAIRKSIKNVDAYQRKIFIGSKSRFSKPAGIRYMPLKRVGIYIPAASAPLPSTVIMTAVPAQVAGVKEIAIVSPPRYKGTIHPVILAVCRELGIEEIYRIGGAQAIAALAYGTNTIKAVDKIVGPGNAWVQMAKRAVFGIVDIDSIAGPSEVLIIANSKTKAAWVAADMLSQAEHAPGSAVLFTDSIKFAKEVLAELEKQIEKLSRRQETLKCLLDFSGIVVFNNIDTCIRQANAFAPEHLEIQCGSQSRSIAKKIENAGAIFIGPFCPVAVGDYWAGPSHTLPTGTSARFFSALSSNDFVKSISIIEYSRKNLAADADDIIRLARAEGLDAHAKSIEIRLDK